MNYKHQPMALLDVRGLLLNLYHAGKDPEAVLGDDGKSYNTAGFAIAKFIEFVIKKIIEEDDIYPRKMVAFWEGGNSRRKDIFPEYKEKKKAGGPKDPVEEAENEKLFKAAKHLLSALGATQVTAPHCEADDAIALFADKLPCPINVYTIDADLLAMSNDKVLVHLKGEPIIGSHKDVPLHLISLSKSILGDTSDCYKGIPGMGMAAWKKLVDAYGLDGMEELEQCVANKDYTMIREALEDEPNAQLQKLYDNRKDWGSMYQLANLHPEWVGTPYKRGLCPINFHKRVPNAERLSTTLNAVGCGDLFADLEYLCPQSWVIGSDDFDFETDIPEMVKSFGEAEIVAFDYESYDPVKQESLREAKKGDYVDTLRHVPVGASFCFGKNFENCIYFPTNHTDDINLSNKWLGRFVEAIEEAGAMPVAHNAGFEIELTERCCDYSPKMVMDTIIMSSYADENVPADLKSLSKGLLNYHQQSYKETVGDAGDMSKLTSEQAALPYGCDDSIVTAHLFDLLYLRLCVEDMWEFYDEYQPDAARVFIEAKRGGIPLNDARLDKYREDMSKEAKETLGKFYALLESNCKSPSPKVVKQFLEEDFIESETKKNNDKEPQDRKTSAQMQMVFESKRQQLLRDAVYEPYKEIKTYKSEKWVPTVLGVNKCLTKIDLPHIESVAASRISDYIASRHESEEELSEKQLEFLNLLGPAASFLKKRSGKSFVAFSDYCKELTKSEDEVKIDYTGFKLNTKSKTIMQLLFYVMFELPVRRRSKVDKNSARKRLGLWGSPSTNVGAFEAARIYDLEPEDWRYQALEALERLASIKTLFSNYFDTFSLWKYSDTGMLHPSLRNCGTTTRRPSCSSPNLLSISSGKDEYRLRSCFPAQLNGWLERGEEPMVVIAIDWSQQELRITASVTEDENMLACYLGEDLKDVHSMSATGILRKTHKMTDLSYEEFMSVAADKKQKNNPLFNKTRKDKAKPTNFLIVYGGTFMALMNKLFVNKKEAKEIFSGVMDMFPGIETWQEKSLAAAKKLGYSLTAFGNRRHATPELFSDDKYEVLRQARQLSNSEIQSTAADVLVVVLARLHRSGLMARTRAKLIAPVYDELVSRVPASTAVTYVTELVDIMRIKPPGQAVTLEVDIGIGPSWGECLEIGGVAEPKLITDAVESAVKISTRREEELQNVGE